MPVDNRNDVRDIKVLELSGEVRACRECGCHEFDACCHPEQGNCWWVEKDLCSHCHLWPGESKKYSELLPENKNDLHAIAAEKEGA